ncbi:MAG: hypothetical protein U5L01_02055 [Rheinheimera sp.]|nr:hypothetical protein [Rheinheimera sp.]
MLTLGIGLSSEGRTDVALLLAAGERRVVQVRAEVEAAVFRGVRSETVFLREGDDARKTESVRCVTTLWPDPTAMAVEVVSDFSHEKKAVDAVAGAIAGTVAGGRGTGVATAGAVAGFEGSDGGGAGGEEMEVYGRCAAGGAC